MADAAAKSVEPYKKGKWTKGVDALGITTLATIAKDIDKTIGQSITAVARAQIKVGVLLIEAKKEFADPEMFLKWRLEETSVKSRQQSEYLIQVAEKFKDAPALIEGVSFSVLRELVTAPQELIKEIEDKVKAGEPTPGAHAVREQIKEAKGGTGVALPSRKPGDTAKKNHMTITQKHEASQVVEQDIKHRMDYFDGTDDSTSLVEKAYVFFGLDPDPTCPPNPDTLLYIREGMLLDEDDEMKKKILAAYNLLAEDHDEFFEVEPDEE